MFWYKLTSPNPGHGSTKQISHIWYLSIFKKSHVTFTFPLASSSNFSCSSAIFTSEMFVTLPTNPNKNSLHGNKTSFKCITIADFKQTILKNGKNTTPTIKTWEMLDFSKSGCIKRERIMPVEFHDKARKQHLHYTVYRQKVDNKHLNNKYLNDR